MACPDRPPTNVEWTSHPPRWWPGDETDMPIFASGRWLRSIGALQAGGQHGWVRAVGRTGVGVMRTTWTTSESVPHSLDPFHWTYEQTAYRDGLAAAGPPALPRTSWFPSLVSVLPGLDTYLVGTDREDVDCAVALLSKVIVEGERLGAASVALGFVQPGETALAVGAARVGMHPVPMATLASLPLPGRGLADVWASYGAKHRANVRRDRRRLAQAGLHAALVDAPLDRLDDLVALRCSHLRTHGKLPNHAVEREHLRMLLEDFGDLTTVVAGFAGDELVAFSAFLRDRDVVHSYMTGRRDARRDRDIYFETTYYLPTELFADRGLSALSYGYGTEEAKRLRGCVLEPVMGYVKHLEGHRGGGTA